MDCEAKSSIVFLLKYKALFGYWICRGTFGGKRKSRGKDNTKYFLTIFFFSPSENGPVMRYEFSEPWYIGSPEISSFVQFLELAKQIIIIINLGKKH